MTALTRCRTGRSYLPIGVCLFLAVPWICCVLGSLVLLAAEQQAKTLISVRLVPDQVTLWGMRASHRFLVLARCADGLERDVTFRARFVVSEPQVAQVEATGRVRALADGRTRLTVEVEEFKAESVVRVEGSSKEQSFSFERDIGGILTKRRWPAPWDGVS